MSPSSSLAQDTGLSRRRRGFESRWGRQFTIAYNYSPGIVLGKSYLFTPSPFTSSFPKVLLATPINKYSRKVNRVGPNSSQIPISFLFHRLIDFKPIRKLIPKLLRRKDCFHMNLTKYQANGMTFSNLKRTGSSVNIDRLNKFVSNS